jgi:putative flavoprotein involved in K+ transport
MTDLGTTVIVIGAGQAGLAVSRALTALTVEHVVLERACLGQAWRDRWDSFCLVTPNWTMDLPGSPYLGDDPEGHVHRDDIVAYLDRYASDAAVPLHEGVDVTSLEPGPGGGFLVRTSTGEDLLARQVVVCTGAYQRPHRPAPVEMFPQTAPVLDVHHYRSPDVLPSGPVLVIGSGQSGCQIAEELHEGGREVVLACGRAPWLPRRIAGLDIVTCLVRAGFYDTPLSALASPADRLVANLQTTGRAGGHDLHYRTLQAAGVHLVGRVSGIHGHHLQFADDLAASVAFGDARYADVRALLRRHAATTHTPASDLPDPAPFRPGPAMQLDLRQLGAVVVTSGFRPDYTRWIRFPAFDDAGYPVTQDGASTTVPGLFFCGVHFLRTRRSSLLFGVGADAELVAAAVAGHRQAPAVRH